MDSQSYNLTIDVGQVIDAGRWSVWQKLAVLLVALTIVLDGFDNQVLGFALPAIIKAWGLPHAAFAPVIALGLVGMSIGTGLAGVAGDRFGRRLTLIGSVVTFGLATAAISKVQTLNELAALRFIAGAGIGGAMPNAAALAAEFTPARRRALAVTLTIGCVPLGGMIGGTVAAQVLPSLGWRALFVMGGLAPLALAALLVFALPESPRFLARLATNRKRLGEVLTRLGHPPPPHAQIVDLTDKAHSDRVGLSALFDRFYLRDTLALWAAFFCTLLAVYSVFSWTPTMLSGQGLDLKAASSGLAIYNFGGVFGAVLAGLLIGWLGSRGVMTVFAVGGAASALALMAMPIHPHGDTLALSLGLGLHGFFVNGVQTTLYALAAHVYLTRVRASGAGAAVGVGRLGAIFSAFAGTAVLSFGPSSFYAMLAIAMAGSSLAVLAVRRHIPKASALDLASH